MTPDARQLLAALLEGWDRHQGALLSLLRLLPPGALAARALPGSPTIGAMFAHMHHERMISVEENAPEHAGTVPSTEWAEARDASEIAAWLDDSARRVRDAVRARIEAGRDLDREFAHPSHLVSFLVFHESYHHGQIKLALKATGQALPDSLVGPEIWGRWRARAADGA